MAPKSKRCGNPLFLAWMTELRDAARDKGSKSAEAYSKACKSLEMCPVTYQRPRELVVLSNIGAKTVALLEKRWMEWQKENGKDIPGDVNGSAIAMSVAPAVPKAGRAGNPRAIADDDDEDLEIEVPKEAPKRKRAQAAPKAYIPAEGSGAYGILLALILAVDRPEITTQVFLTKGEIIRTASNYCDVSYEHSEKGTYFTAWSSMKTLVQKGYVYVTGNPHKHCLTEEGYNVAAAVRTTRPEFAHIEKHPFSHAPAAGTSTTVSEMPRNRPLSALELYNGPSNLPSNLTAEYTPPSGSHSSPASRLDAFNAATSKIVSGEKFIFWYITDSGSRTALMNDAHMKLDFESFVNLRRIEFRYSQRSHPFVGQLRLVDDLTTATIRDTSGAPTVFGYIAEADAPPRCSMHNDLGGTQTHAKATGRHRLPNTMGSSPIMPPRPRPSLAGRSETSSFILDDDFAPKKRPIVDPSRSNYAALALGKDTLTSSATAEPKRAAGSSAWAAAKTRNNSYDSMGQWLEAQSVSTFSRTGNTSTTAAQPRTSSLSALNAGPSSTAIPPERSHSSTAVMRPQPPIIPRAGPRLSSHVPSPIPAPEVYDGMLLPPDSPVTFPSFSASDAIVFPANSYDIILILDSREVESKTSRDKFQETLEQKGVRVETRALRLGDMCWVARRRDGLGGEEDECVLDYVVERKRLDDLVHSIKDGRYTEQCFRLQNACISNVYYIVEDWQVTQKMDESGLAIMTCKSQIQIHNRFFLKETHRLAETIDFLSTMTNVIKSSHHGKPLHVIPSRYLSRSSYQPLQTHLKLKYPAHTFHTSFTAYQELNDKSASQTLREKFARMMMCVKGMSAERASALLDEWDTPRALWDSMVDRDRQPENQELSQGQAKGKKKKTGKGMFFAERVQGEARRKIGDALSENLWTALMG